MTLEYYRNFVTIVECGNILSAARKIPMAQSALSHQLQVMEKEYGVKLLHRGARMVELTDAGRIIYQKAKAICALVDSAHTEIVSHLAGIEGTLSVALPPTNSPSFLDSMFGGFSRAYPNVNLVLSESSSHDVAQYVETGTSEIGFMRSPVINNHLFELFKVNSEWIEAVVPEDHPLAEQEEIHFRQIENYKLSVPKGCTSTVLEAAKKYGFLPMISVITTSRTIAIECARIRSEVALVALGEEEIITSENMKIIKISDCQMEIPRGFIIKKNANLSHVAKNFFAYHNIALGKRG